MGFKKRVGEGLEIGLGIGLGIVIHEYKFAHNFLIYHSNHLKLHKMSLEKPTALENREKMRVFLFADIILPN